jgi:transcriptional regulator with XRE-family HTH domain
MELKRMIAEWVRQARTEAGMSGAALGAKLALELGTDRGHTRANISHWETQKHGPNLQQMLAISKVTGKSLPPSILAAMQASGDASSGAAKIEDPGLAKNGAPLAAVPSSTETTLERLNAEEKGILELFRSATRDGKTMIHGAATVAPKAGARSIRRPN